MLWFFLAGRGLAEPVALPSYAEALADETWHRFNRRLEAACSFDPRVASVVCDEATARSVLEDLGRWQEEVQRTAGLAYLEGLGHRYLGEADRAAALWRDAVAANPNYAAAWHDLGELALTRGDWTEAEACFREVARLQPDGPQAWVAPWRLAETAAHRGDAQAFEAWMKEALQRGFSFRQIRGLPNWKTFLADPRLTDSVQKLLTVYAEPEVLDSLRP